VQDRQHEARALAKRGSRAVKPPGGDQ
jgi:hypothetical protein